jgi:trans-2,3-dihydro-3-hydroxyanthranilate isomerase
MNPDARRLQFYKADVFTDQPFGGNPVAVFPDCEGLSNREFQQIAREMNLSETVFILPPSEERCVAKLRIFTPTQEIPFAGHPVLGTFFVLATLKRFRLVEPITRVTFECNIGIFSVELFILGGIIDRVVMAQPKPEFLGSIDGVQDLYEVSKALGVPKSVITETHLPIEVVSTGLPVMVVPLRSLPAVKSVNIDLSALSMFAGPIGVIEDPATGSASGALGGYLVHNGIVDVGPTTEIISEQGYEIDRPSRILIQVLSDDDMIQEVRVGGQVVLVAEGKLVF